jgi:hypothetical protein
MRNLSRSTGAYVRRLTLDDAEAYAEFRLKMWPVHSGAGGWESVRLKYFHNPQAALCPESGLYAYIQGEEILGMMGAYPMPVTLDGSIYAGHMVVDWAVLPERQFGPVTGTLWNTLTSLPGRKFSSIGTRASQSILEKRAVRIRSTNAVAYLRPLEAKMLRGLRLEGYSYPSPLLLERAQLPRGVRPALADSFKAPSPKDAAQTAFVARDRDFWNVYCSGRPYNGAVPLNIATSVGEANVVIRLLEVGRFRYANLMALDLMPGTIENARRSGTLLRDSLAALSVTFVNAVDVDELTREMLHSLSRYVSRSESYWWGIRRPSDTFQIESVRWWLTNADRDSHWAGNQPFAFLG